MSNETLIIVLQVTTLIFSFLSPLIASMSFFISHIKKSKCCFGAEIEMRKSSAKDINKIIDTNKRMTVEIIPVKIV